MCWQKPQHESGSLQACVSHHSRKAAQRASVRVAQSHPPSECSSFGTGNSAAVNIAIETMMRARAELHKGRGFWFPRTDLVLIVRFPTPRLLG